MEGTTGWEKPEDDKTYWKQGTSQRSFGRALAFDSALPQTSPSLLSVAALQGCTRLFCSRDEWGGGKRDGPHVKAPICPLACPFLPVGTWYGVTCPQMEMVAQPTPRACREDQEQCCAWMLSAERRKLWEWGNVLHPTAHLFHELTP